ncbi:Response regulator with CheY-like receiver, AAA-type ATPase, and DNA-binding domains [uncultured Desulfobacterium sp.]|uniref:Response regulator with CheY-like receiver, AAA-type ATPase, and DNA-binding domains n=1 Tax=uncultured Desulfobacterium sp. TaxID=201089 RepID=A0A445N2B4_9BACT|nr:Response regulator with CheY-like receiver, AAA-type ATPase, and DNA-binding domains [uncultured Desulfobacterium sp.]
MKTRILLVDDEEDFVQVLSERLKIRDYNVDTSFSGEDALAKVKNHDFDVVILDVAMPGMNGITALREIKAVKPLTEVIMLTGKATVDTAIEGMKLGAYDYVLKPCDTEKLSADINKAHQRKTEHEDRIREAKVRDILVSRGV